MSLIYIAREVSIYSGAFFLIVGTVGNGMNAFILASVRSYRTTPCSFYFLVGSINNTVYILITLTIRIVASAFGVDLTNTSLIWCKARAFVAGSICAIAIACSSLAIIDQFLATSQNAQFRRLSNIKLAHRIMLVTIIIWCIHGSIAAVLFNITPFGCIPTNTDYIFYVSVYTLIILCVIPVSIMIIFGYLAYRNIRLTAALARQHVDRQLARMTLVQVTLAVITGLPFGINSAYQWITRGIVKSVDRQLQESFATTIFTLVYYFYYGGNFYVFLASSSRFRQTVRKRLFGWRRGNQIDPS